MKNQSLFDQVKATPTRQHVPLAERMRPQTLEDIVGQDQVVGPGSVFGRMLRDADSPVPSVILTGPPGVGKTSIAQVVANESGYRFVRMSGVLDGVKELRTAVEEARTALNQSGKPTLALVDEIHRFNKAQQDAFLPHVESGLLAIIGQTTENVSFRVRNALLSRLRVLELQPLQEEYLVLLLNKALSDTERGLGEWNLSLDEVATAKIIKLAGGDARRALTCLEWAASHARSSKVETITEEIVEESYGTQPALFDQDGDYHYDNISAFIKSMRGSDPDAALYYLVRALEGGEDPLFLTRRMIIFASEDAACDPRALELAINVDRAVERVGFPEGRIPMAHAAVYLSCCSKSNASYKALRQMEQVVAENPNLEIPRRLRNAPTDLMREQGNSEGYRYPHDYPGAFVPESYLPEKLKDLIVYEPTDRGMDIQIAQRLEDYRERIRKEK